MITMRRGINLWGAIYVKSDFGSEMDYDMLVCNVYIVSFNNRFRVQLRLSK